MVSAAGFEPATGIRFPEKLLLSDLTDATLGGGLFATVLAGKLPVLSRSPITGSFPIFHVHARVFTFRHALKSNPPPRSATGRDNVVRVVFTAGKGVIDLHQTLLRFQLCFQPLP